MISVDLDDKDVDAIATAVVARLSSVTTIPELAEKSERRYVTGGWIGPAEAPPRPVKSYSGFMSRGVNRNFG